MPRALCVTRREVFEGELRWKGGEGERTSLGDLPSMSRNWFSKAPEHGEQLMKEDAGYFRVHLTQMKRWWRELSENHAPEPVNTSALSVILCLADIFFGSNSHLSCLERHKILRRITTFVARGEKCSPCYRNFWFQVAGQSFAFDLIGISVIHLEFCSP